MSPPAQKLAEYAKTLGSSFSVVVVAGQAGSTPPIENFQGIRIVRVAFAAPDLRTRIEAFERAVKRQLESEQPGIVFLADPFAGYSVFQQKPRFGFKVVFDGQDLASEALLARRKDLNPDSDAVEKIQKRERFCMGHADLVLGVGADSKAMLALGAKTGRVHVRPEGIPATQLQTLCLALAGRGPSLQFGTPSPSVLETTQPAVSRALTGPSRGLPVDLSDDMSDEVTLIDVPVAGVETTLPSFEAVDSWYAQLVLGYCPPENTEFARHTPATNFPGRDATNPPAPPRKR
jgi:hypothetical protein